MSELQGMFGASGSGDTSGFGGLVRSTPNVGSSQRPYGSYFDEVADELERAYPEFSDAIEKAVVDRGELTLHIKREKLFETAMKLRDTQSLRFEICLGVSGVHYPEDKNRELHAVYPLLSMTHNRRIRLEVSAPDSDPHIPSVVEVWAGNNWHERETHEMFGIKFDGHPDLRNMYLPVDFEGFPLRKDFPLLSRMVKPWPGIVDVEPLPGGDDNQGGDES